MTFEEFKTRAKQLSTLPEKVRCFIGAIVTTGDFQVNPHSVYPSCRARGVIFHSAPSLAEAEEYIRTCKNSSDDGQRIYAYNIFITPDDDDVVYDDQDEVLYFRKILYDAEGNKLDETPYETYYDFDLFRGRDSDTVRFKKEDVVEFFEGIKVNTGIIVDLPLTVEKLWNFREKISQRLKNEGEPTDDESLNEHTLQNHEQDCYLVLVDDGGEKRIKVEALDVIGLAKCVSPSQTEQMKKTYEQYRRDEELYLSLNGGNPDMLSFRNRAMIDNSSFCGCYNCQQLMYPDDIVSWIDDGRTALCPFCGTDSVIGDGGRLPLDKKFLEWMNSRYF